MFRSIGVSESLFCDELELADRLNGEEASPDDVGCELGFHPKGGSKTRSVSVPVVEEDGARVFFDGVSWGAFDWEEIVL